MKSQVILGLMCMTVSLTQPGWSMNEDDFAQESSTTATPKRPKGENESQDQTVIEFPHPGINKDQRVAQGNDALECLVPDLLKSLPIPLGTKISFLEDAAGRGDMKAQWLIAKLYLEQDKPDWGNAVPWLERLTEKGHRKAEYALGRYYGKVIHNNAEAIKWYELAAAHGHKAAHFELSCAYRVGPEQNIDKANTWLQSGANLGDRLCQNLLGNFYEYGTHVPKNIKKAIEYYTLSAEQGYPFSMYCLGNLYKEGLTNDKNIPEWDKAIFWYAKGAYKGEQASQYWLGSCCQFGIGQIPVDIAKAFQWYTLSANKGCPIAREALATIQPIFNHLF